MFKWGSLDFTYKRYITLRIILIKIQFYISSHTCQIYFSKNFLSHSLSQIPLPHTYFRILKNKMFKIISINITGGVQVQKGFY